MEQTTIQVPKKLRDDIKMAAQRYASDVGINRLSMVDYLQLIIAKQPKAKL